MHDIKAIRENPAAFDAALARRGLSAMSSEILALDADRRAKIVAAETAQAEQNRASKEVGAAKARGDDAEFERLRALVAQTKADIARLTAEAGEQDVALRDLLMGIPNLPLDEVPDGTDEADNVEVHRWGTPRAFDFTPKEHFEIAGAKPGLDFATAAKLSGTRFVVLRGAMARLHRALAQFMLDTHTEDHQLQEMWTPVLVRDDAMYGTNQLPKFAEDSFIGDWYLGRADRLRTALGYKTEQDIQKIASGAPLEDVVDDILERAPTKEGFWLIPTSEVTLTNTVAGDILDESALPIRMTAHTQCFRSEAGSAGKDTSGMLRQHQFEKVEMVTICTPDTHLAEQDRMRRCAEAILEKLNIPYRTVVLCTGDMGFGAQRTFDLEAWLPGQNTYREISSVSTCGQFQGRRMNARYRAPKTESGGGKPDFVATLNGSGLAVGRCLIAVLENGQQADGSVDLPAVLHPYLGGRTKITAKGQLA
ncbi:MAG: serine--tRNA ligase [Pseudotabrizicola sp.]|uniref:serine--tRNA ligase n=1 Tax=Pseudotabrizicola sp. TaxID=2939647 RepID=UPI002726A984|nr:serine--tRNA ligase [Pseudotabrizicola sp.]MDO9638787.1 serine--tRNA ligase [Pseudotabrizicola sp.]